MGRSKPRIVIKVVALNGDTSELVIGQTTENPHGLPPSKKQYEIAREAINKLCGIR